MAAPLALAPPVVDEDDRARHADDAAATGPRSALNVTALAGALHEVSNALTVVLGWIDRAEGASDAGDDARAALAVARGRAAAARDLVRGAIGAEVAPPPPRSAAELAADAALGLEPEAERAAVRVRTCVEARAASAVVEHSSIVMQILTNLLLNALAVAPRGSAITLEVAIASGGRDVLFAVADAGPGIPDERRATLFVSGQSTRAGGAGIGLRHAAALAHVHGGELALGDADCGARFELRWPLRDAHAPSERTPRVEPASPVALHAELAGVRILMVEDDDAVVDLLELALGARGAEVHAVRTRAELDGALATGPFDAVLFDLSPIRDDVRGAVGVVRASNPSARVILISGTVVDTSELPDEWIAAWVRKPFEVAEIVGALRAR